MTDKNTTPELDETDELDELDEAAEDEAAAAGAAEDEDEAAEDAKPERFYVVITMPEDMKALWTSTAKAAGMSNVAYGLKYMSEKLGYTLPEGSLSPSRGPATKYTSPEARKAAQSGRNKARREWQGLLARQAKLTKQNMPAHVQAEIADKIAKLEAENPFLLS